MKKRQKQNSNLSDKGKDPFFDFQGQAKAFCGLYEALYIAHEEGDEERCLDVLMEWRIRLQSMADSPFQSMIVEKIEISGERGTYVETAAWLLSRIFDAGIKRDMRKSIQAEGLDLLRYGAIDGRNLNKGERSEVMLPCWYLGNILLERGILS